MQNASWRRLLQLLVVILVLASRTGLVASALEHKSTVHTHSISGGRADASAVPAATSPDSAKKEIERDSLTPEQLVEANRKSLVEHIANFKVSPDHPNANKLLAAVKPTAEKYLSVPLKLTDKKISADAATLTYASADPKFDFSLTSDFTRDGNKWTLTNTSFKGDKGVELPAELYSDVTGAFPVESGVLYTCMIVLVLLYLVSAIAGLWLIVLACRTSVPWGIAILLIPFAWLAFAITNWQVARKPVLAIVGTGLAATLTVAVGIGVMYSLRDIVSAIPDTMIPKSSTRPMHEI